MKKLLFSAFASLLFFNVNAQKFFTKTGKIYFTAGSSIEKIEATTNKSTAVVDLATGKMEVKLLVKGFHFEKALMEEHFNENYLESGKFPDANFAGSITDLKSVDLKKDGTYTVKVAGKLTLHGVTKDVTTTAKLTTKSGAITNATTNFNVVLADYKVAIPGPVKEKIAKEAKIDVTLALQPLK